MTDDLRIDEVEKEVKKLKSDVENFMELKNTINDLKNTVMDIRALMSETQNPFNLLQFITDEDELNKVVQAKPLLEKKFLARDEAEAKAEGKVESKGAAAGAEVVGKEVGFVVESHVEGKDVAEVEKPENVERDEEMTDKVQTENRLEDKEKSEEDASSRIGEAIRSSRGKGISVIHWIYEMLDLGFDEKSIRKICDYCEFFCFMPKGYSTNISNLVGAVVRARSHKLSAEELMLSIYSAADAVGVKIDSKDLSGLIVHVLEKSKANECVKCAHTRS